VGGQNDCKEVFMISDILLFSTLALVAIASALGMLFSRNAIYSALNLIVNFGTVALFYLILGAPFIALVQVTVYAGAIMVLFLFVIMLLGIERLRAGRTFTWQEAIAVAAGIILIVEAAYVIFIRPSNVTGYPPIPLGFGSANAVGLELYNYYLLPFEITSVLLLVAMIGAIILSKRHRKAQLSSTRLYSTAVVPTDNVPVEYNQGDALNHRQP
jgi:NADH-quinone oxidoreductase subunit J